MFTFNDLYSWDDAENNHWDLPIHSGRLNNYPFQESSTGEGGNSSSFIWKTCTCPSHEGIWHHHLRGWTLWSSLGNGKPNNAPTCPSLLPLSPWPSRLWAKEPNRYDGQSTRLDSKSQGIKVKATEQIAHPNENLLAPNTVFALRDLLHITVPWVLYPSNLEAPKPAVRVIFDTFQDVTDLFL